MDFMDVDDEIIDLWPERSKLNPRFKEYKRIEDKQGGGYERILPEYPRVTRVHKGMYSREHTKLFYTVNHLHRDRWNPNMMYFIDCNWAIYSIKDTEDEGIAELLLMHKNDELWDKMHEYPYSDEDRYHPTMVFPSPDLALMTDGYGFMMLLKTGDRTEQKPWKLHTWNRCMMSFVLLDGCKIKERDAEGREQVVYITGFVVDEPRNHKFHTSINFYTIPLTEEGVPTLSREGPITLPCVNVDYASVSETGDCFVVSNANSFDQPYTVGLDRQTLMYTWQQNSEELLITLGVGSTYSKRDIKIDFSLKRLCVAIDGSVLIAGELEEQVEADQCVWCLVPKDRRLEITLVKKKPGYWKYIINGERRGEYIDNPDIVDTIQSRIRVMNCKDDLYTFMCQGIVSNTPAHPGNIENYFPKQQILLCQIGNRSKKPKVTMRLNGTWLFHLPPEQGKPKAICGTSHVDGVVYMPTCDGAKPYKHIATLDGLGEELDSKPRWFTTCSPDFSYAATSDTNVYIIIYRPRSIDTKTGEVVDTAGTKQLLRLPRNDTICGLAAMNKSIYALTRSYLYKYKV